MRIGIIVVTIRILMLMRFERGRGGRCFQMLACIVAGLFGDSRSAVEGGRSMILL